MMRLFANHIKTVLIDAKRWVEHFWEWDLKPLFGKE